MRRSADRARRRGAALAFAVLLMLGLLGLAHGILVAALAELSASRAAVRLLGARAAAESGVRLALKVPAGPWMDSVAPWERRIVVASTLGRWEATGAARRLAAESWLVEGEGVRVGGATTRSAALAWSLDPLTRVRALAGAVSVGPGSPLVLAGPVDAGAPASVAAPLTEADCEDWVPSLLTHYLDNPLAPVAMLAAEDGGLDLGMLGLDSLLSMAEVHVEGAGTPQPVDPLGACGLAEPWNWGDPERPWRPCGPFLALRGSAGDLLVDGGVGQGVLVADGAVTLTAGARFYGLVVAGGTLEVSGGASLEGMAMAAGGLRVAGDGLVKASACWATRALDANRSVLGRLRPLEGGRAIGPL